jgi:hypothetical protein
VVRSTFSSLFHFSSSSLPRFFTISPVSLSFSFTRFEVIKKKTFRSFLVVGFLHSRGGGVDITPVFFCFFFLFCFFCRGRIKIIHRATNTLAAEAVERASLPLERVDDVEGRDGLAASVLGVGDRVADDVLKEHLEDAAGLLVDEPRDALDATTASETADGRLRDSLDVVAQDLAVPLGAALSEALAALAASGHCCWWLSWLVGGEEGGRKKETCDWRPAFAMVYGVVLVCWRGSVCLRCEWLTEVRGKQKTTV